MKIASRAGFSTVELMVSLGIGTMVMVGTLSVMSQLSQVQTDQRVANLIDQTYFSGVQTTHNSVLMNALLSPATDSDLMACLAGKGVNCTTHERLDIPPRSLAPTGNVNGNGYTDATLNQDFTTDGPCVPGAPNCIVRRTTTYRWVCPTDDYCSGARIWVRADYLPKPGTRPGLQFRGREGDFMLPARDFVPKRALATTCANGGSGIASINFDKGQNQDECTQFNAGPGCSMPMSTYGTATSNCQPNQLKDCSNLGFSISRLYDESFNCIGAVDVSKAVAVTPQCPGGGVFQNGECEYANRWCHLNSADGSDTAGFQSGDPGSVHRAGCFSGSQWYNTDQIYTVSNGQYWVCKTGPVAAYPLPNDPYCPVKAAPPPPAGGHWGSYYYPNNGQNLGACSSISPAPAVGATCNPTFSYCYINSWDMGAGNKQTYLWCM